MRRIGPAAVVPVDDAQAAVRRGQHVVRPEVAVTGLEPAGRLEQALECDQLPPVVGEPIGERRPGPRQPVDQVVPLRRPHRLGVPRVSREPGVVSHPVDGGDHLADRHRVDRRIGRRQIDPAVHPDRGSADAGEDVTRSGADHGGGGNSRRSGRLLEPGGALGLGDVPGVERSLHRPTTAVGDQMPYLPLLTARSRSGEAACRAQPEPIGDLLGMARLQPFHQGHGRRAVASSSAACRRPASLSGIPASILVSSSTRPCSSSNRTAVVAAVRSTT